MLKKETKIHKIRHFLTGHYLPKKVMIGHCIKQFLNAGERFLKAKKNDYNAAAPRLKPGDARVVFYMDENFSATGLNDRMSAIIAVFDACQRLGVKFKLYHTFPFDFSDFFVPAKCDWRISYDELCRNPADVIFLDASKIRKFHHRKNHKVPKIYNDFCRFSYRATVPVLEHYIKNSPEKQIQIFAMGTFHKTFKSFFSTRFHELFKMNQKLQNAVENATKDWNSRGGYVVMHFRFLSLLGKFEKGNSYPVLPENEQREVIKKCIQKTRELYEKDFKGKIVLALSDSQKFLDAISAECDFVRTLTGTIKHTNTTANGDFDAHFKTIFDYMVIAGAQKVLALTTGEMYKGGYARGAALVNNVPFKRIEF